MHKTFNVFVIDDDEDDQMLIQAAFQQDSGRYKLQFVSDGTATLANMDRSLPVPDLILLDLNMPLINGFEVLQQLKRSPAYCRVPVVILTTSDHQKDIDKAYELGASSFITKPIDHQSLIDLAAQIRLYWFGLIRFPSSHST